MSMIKLREVGFTRTIDTGDACWKPVQPLMDRKASPPARVPIGDGRRRSAAFAAVEERMIATT